MNIYKYNPQAKYTPKQYAGGINLSKNRIFVNNRQYIDLNFPDIFEDYNIVRNRDEWELSNQLAAQLHGRPPRLNEYFHFYRCQLNFAIHCSTSVLGISKQHLTEGSALLKSIYGFHVYYHIRRIFKILGAPTPNQDQFVKWSNRYSITGYHKVCSEYGVNNPSPVWMTGKWEFSYYGLFEDGSKQATKYTHFDNNYSRWIMPAYNGLTGEALNLLSDSVRAYVYLLLGSQGSARRDILNSPAARSIFIDYLEDIIGRPVDTAADIARYEKVLNKARSKVDFAIADDVYMLPPNMLLKVGNIKGYNNNLLIANESVEIGVINQHINVFHKPPVDDLPKHIPLPEHEKKTIKRSSGRKRGLDYCGCWVNSSWMVFFFFLN